MKHEDIVALAKQAGFNGDERIYDWCYTYHTSREFDDSYKQAFRLDITPEVIALVELAVKKEREAVITQAIAEGFISENYAEQFAAAIRKRGNT